MTGVPSSSFGYIIDPDVLLLATIAGTLASDYANPSDDPWAGSPFAWIKTRPSRQVGKIGEQLVAGWCAAKGLDVLRSHNTQFDRIINNKRVEIKFSTLWKSRDYVFQQIRDQQYDVIFLLGVSPFAASAWAIPKHILASTDLGLAGLTGQHTGSMARDTMWLRFPSSDPPKWMTPYGGTLAQAYKSLAD